jgi:hypothetical protein
MVLLGWILGEFRPTFSAPAVGSGLLSVLLRRVDLGERERLARSVLLWIGEKTISIVYFDKSL